LTSPFIFVVGKIGLDEAIELVERRACVGSTVSGIGALFLFVGENVFKSARTSVRVIFVSVASL
jgi:hypothetical protein